ncbi:hypothetical protein SAMN04487995_0972 [Dyadobacter koreensis]|uniref:Uncharacterized protein n=1 Tax=Dyadobacter koreensis TaxID=408657 RepID=A0A1H6R204_9BACT|nr:hypothetical protein [Dyadobacter koreensis]SEI49851.1 hypothetical protein SAMN04487995_0972 [Dyadobacter koreensis]
MKNIAIALVILAMTTGSLSANCSTSEPVVEFILQDKVSVKPEDLPQPIKTTLATDVYAGWEITEAFIITKEDKTQFFEISLKKGSETAKINLDKDGRKVE